MNRRPHRVMFRLTPEEFQRYAPLVRTQYLWNWSELVRKALKEYATAVEQRASDNAVRQADLQTKTPASKSPAKKKPTRPARSGRGKAKV